MGINGILTNVCSWSCKPYIDKDGLEHKGAQIDLIIERGDKTINLCEMKFTNKPFAISTEYAQRLLERRDTFRDVTGTKMSLQLTMVTSASLVHNAGWQNINNEVDVDDLFSLIMGRRDWLCGRTLELCEAKLTELVP